MPPSVGVYGSTLMSKDAASLLIGASVSSNNDTAFVKVECLEAVALNFKPNHLRATMRTAITIKRPTCISKFKCGQNAEANGVAAIGFLWLIDC